MIMITTKKSLQKYTRINKYLHTQTDRNMLTPISIRDFPTSRYVVDAMIAIE